MCSLEKKNGVASYKRNCKLAYFCYLFFVPLPGEYRQIFVYFSFALEWKNEPSKCFHHYVLVTTKFTNYKKQILVDDNEKIATKKF